MLSPAGRRDLGPDQHAAFLELAPGWHRIALRVDQEDAGWGVQVRVTAPDGRPLDRAAVRIEIPADRAAAEREIAAGGVRHAVVAGHTVTAFFESAAKGGAPLAKALLGQDLAARRLPERSDARAVTLVREAVAAAPRDVDVLWAAAIVDSDPARRREALEQILVVDPTHPAALRRLAGYHLEYGRTDASLEEARRSLKACGKGDPYLAGWEALARDGRGFPAGALATLQKLAAAHPRQVSLLERMADLARHEGLHATARRAFEQALEQDRGNERLRDGYLDLLSDMGDAAGVRRVIDGSLALDPLDMGWRSRLARLLLSEGRPDEARTVVENALVLAPGSPPLLELLGETRLALGDAKGAAESWRQALGAAQDPGALGERIAALTGEDDTFGAEWTASLEDAAKLEAQVPVEGDPPAVVVRRTAAFRVRADGLGTRFTQVLMRVRHPEQATFARSFGFSYSPQLERATVIAARLLRKDGTIVLAGRNDRPLLGDPEIRMWYDTRVVDLVFPRLEEGDLIDVRWRVSDRGPGNPLGDGYFGEFWLAGDRIPVLTSRLVIESAASRPVAHQLVNLPQPAAARHDQRGDTAVTVLDLPPLPAYEDAPLAPPPTARLPYAIVGTIEDWGDLGRLYSRLIRDQAAAGPDLAGLVQRVTANVRTERDKVRALYDWVIENTRYVALELGIHALKPYDVPSVYRRRFGDCKDKATLLFAMLREAGIEARVALVRTRDRGPLDTKVPTFAAFDHAIVYVPSQDLWLDGTVMHHAIGEVPAPDRNVLSLLVDPYGEKAGQLVTIPEMTPADAFTGRREEIALEADGAAAIGVQVEARGDDAGRERAYFRGTDRPGTVLANRLRHAYPDLSLVESKFEAVGLDDPAVKFSYRARTDRFARQEGEALSAPLGLSIPELPVDMPAPDRKLPLELPPPFERTLQSRITLPPGFVVGELPPAERLDTPWGLFDLAVRESRRGVDVTVTLRFTGGTVPLDRIPEFASFLERTRHALGGRIVLRSAR